MEKVTAMQITVELPDEVARQLGAGQDLSRAALEGLVAEGCWAPLLKEVMRFAWELHGIAYFAEKTHKNTHSEGISWFTAARKM